MINTVKCVSFKEASILHNCSTMSNKKIFLSLKEDGRISCPSSKNFSNDEHPRVYINFQKDGSGICPYCGSCFIRHR